MRLDRRQRPTVARPGGTRLEDYCEPGSAFLTVERFAQYLGVDEKTVRKFEGAKAGDLKMHRFGRQLRIHVEDGKAFIAASRLSRSA